MEKRFTIKGRKLLVTEGKEDAALFKRFLGDLGIYDVQVLAVNGIPKFKERLPGIFKLPKFRNVLSLGIIRDAEKKERNPQNSARDAYTSIFNILIRDNKIERVLGRRVDLNYMNKWKSNAISVGIFITCKPGERYGMLEDLCLDSVKGKMELKCVERYLRCVRNNDPNYLDYYKIPSKNKILAYLASKEEAHGSIAVAAEKGIWNVSDNSFDELRQFLEEFRCNQ